MDRNPKHTQKDTAGMTRRSACQSWRATTLPSSIGRARTRNCSADSGCYAALRCTIVLFSSTMVAAAVLEIGMW
jgi:hypothetical protein